MATTLTVTAAFTKNQTEPATGLTLSEIALYLYAFNKATDAVTTIWNGTQNPDTEISTLGIYTKRYTSADLDTYVYFSGAHYTGATALDAAWITGSAELGMVTLSAAQLTVLSNAMLGGGNENVTINVQSGGINIDGVAVWLTTDAAGADKVAGPRYTTGTGNVSFLMDPGTYYVWKQRNGHNFTNPTTITVVES